ncbi:MAG: N-acetylglucosamine-6-phosphate deacetylase [Culicoidibacterales bacterium]
MLIINGKIYTVNGIIENGFVQIVDEKIHAYGSMDQVPQNVTPVVDADGKYVVPGFVDQHIHGAAGVDTMDANLAGLVTFAQALPKEGTTSFLATTMTQSIEAIDAALRTTREFIENHNVPGQAQIMGIHLEGPFVNCAYKGAQPEQYIINPSIETMQHFIDVAGPGNIKLVTYAPEVAEPGFVEFLVANNIVPSVGHSNATFTEVESDYEKGLTNVTHFHNASSGHHHRTPGVVTAGFGLDLTVELICDGVHLHPDVVKTVKKVKGSDKIVLVTDSMCAKGLEDGDYSLGGQKVIKVGNEARLEDGTLAGSVAEMNCCAHNMKVFTDASVEEIVAMTATNAARSLGLNDKGNIQIGCDADIVIMDEMYEIQMTICRGTIAYTL